MDVNAAMKDGAYFMLDGNLNGAGKVKFWKEIDFQIELFEARRLLLKPISVQVRQSNLSSRPTPRQRGRSNRIRGGHVQGGHRGWGSSFRSNTTPRYFQNHNKYDKDDTHDYQY